MKTLSPVFTNMDHSSRGRLREAQRFEPALPELPITSVLNDPHLARVVACLPVGHGLPRLRGRARLLRRLLRPRAARRVVRGVVGVELHGAVVDGRLRGRRRPRRGRRRGRGGEPLGREGRLALGGDRRGRHALEWSRNRPCLVGFSSFLWNWLVDTRHARVDWPSAPPAAYCERNCARKKQQCEMWALVRGLSI